MTSNSSSSAAVRFVIVGFDGLRPDSVEADMPALSRFMASNHSWSHYLADFPTETYVNHPGIFSGFRPTGHGLVANCYWRRDMGGADGVFFGFDLEHVLRHRREDGLLLVPTMGERLGAAGKTMRVYCANSKGSTRLQHLYADRYPDHVCACVHDLVTSVPDNERPTFASSRAEIPKRAASSWRPSCLLAQETTADSCLRRSTPCSRSAEAPSPARPSTTILLATPTSPSRS